MKWNLEEWDNYLTETVEENGKTVKRKMVEYNSLQEIKNIYRQRANYEMHYISKMGFEGYYLLVHSYVSTVRRRGIARGSGGGSLIAYLCGIVDIDPIKYNLLFLASLNYTKKSHFSFILSLKKCCKGIKKSSATQKTL